MITISAALKAHFAQPYQTTCSLLKITRTDGVILGLTDHDQPVTFGGTTYDSTKGYTRTDIAGAADLTVDNLEIDGILLAPSITEASTLAGLWDYAKFVITVVNWADLTMGGMILRAGRVGEITTLRDTFKLDLRGITQAYSRTIGELTSASCRAELFDARCKVNPASFTVTGTITGLNANDATVLYDSARTEPGPTGGVAVTGVSNSNPGHVTLADGSSFNTGETVMLSGIVGPALLNTSTFIRNLSGNVFDLGIDTSNTAVYPAYVSGGTCTPLGGNSGYFDYGVITFNTGLNAGLSMEVRSYVVGQWILQLPMPYAVQIGDAYTMVAGCDKSLSTCKTKYGNVVNFRGEPYLPGLDKIVQVGKQP